jgi:hypothetical protein
VQDTNQYDLCKVNTEGKKYEISSAMIYDVLVIQEGHLYNVPPLRPKSARARSRGTGKALKVVIITIKYQHIGQLEYTQNIATT